MVAGFWAFVIVAILLAEHGWGAIAAGVLVGIAAWVLEAKLWPEYRCWWPFCDRGRTSWSPFTTGAARPCWVCGGRGRRRRVFSGRGS